MWQDIATAPRDGTHILARRIPIGIRVTYQTHPPTVVHWFDDPDEPGFYTSVNELAPAHPYKPTHWMPLPIADSPTQLTPIAWRWYTGDRWAISTVDPGPDVAGRQPLYAAPSPS